MFWSFNAGVRNQLPDGIYSLIYSVAVDGGEATSHGLAMVRNGAIIGSDAAGSLIEGHFEPAASGSCRVRARLAIPAGGVLLTGLAAGDEGLEIDLVARPIGATGLKFKADVAGVTVEITAAFAGPLPKALAARARCHP